LFRCLQDRGNTVFKSYVWRRARIDASSAFQHIVIRGIERNAIFENDKDREDFIERLSMGFGLQVTSAF
jgi:hypothetical protein